MPAPSQRRGILTAAVTAAVLLTLCAVAAGSSPPPRAAWSPELEPPGGPPVASAARSRRPVGAHPAIIVPFAPPLILRPVRRADRLVAFWGDGRACSVGCRAPGARPGWPLLPFHSQHPLRAGLNERRTGSMHVGVDIQARDFARVFAIQPGRAHILQRSGIDARVQVGRFIYWHIYPHVSEGQWVSPYRTLVGTVQRHLGHLHLSEVLGPERWLNPLRPGGRILAPYTDHVRPVIGYPEIHRERTVYVRAYDPQSYVRHTTYPTPVLAPAALAYRVFRLPSHRPVGPLHWALRGSQHYGVWAIPRVYVPDARGGGFLCFAYHPRCTPNWHYRLAGGLAPRLPAGPGRYRLSVYAWDWLGNVRAIDRRYSVRGGFVVPG